MDGRPTEFNFFNFESMLYCYEIKAYFLKKFIFKLFVKKLQTKSSRNKIFYKKKKSNVNKSRIY